MAGFKLFTGKALCSECHVLDRGPHNEPALFTDYTYDNLGVPRNPALPFYQVAGEDWVDPGLAGFLATDPVYDILSPGAMGKQKVPTLRNVDARPTPNSAKAYMHNGYFKTLEGVVRFYNTRDVWPACESDLVTEADALAAKCWPAAELPETVNTDELGNLKLTDQDEANLVAFLKTLTDGNLCKFPFSPSSRRGGRFFACPA
ncbi:cytochrome-c peroxidase [Profundibacter sp.]|uniref:cytochrome-c peroxidase n=1 Tax=Profundibacter sp. TaxID=3101071 RepID=UPI003D0FDFF0